MALFETVQEKRPSPARRRGVMVLAFLLVGGIVLWYLLRFHSEKVVIHHFMDAVVAGNMQEAYRIWQPTPSYTMDRFLEDWGSNSYYGPVRSYLVKDASRVRKGSAVEVVVEVSPDAPFPSNDDAAKQSKVKEVKLWVDPGQHSVSFPPF